MIDKIGLDWFALVWFGWLLCFGSVQRLARWYARDQKISEDSLVKI